MYNFHHKTLEMKKYTDIETRVCMLRHHHARIEKWFERSEKNAGIT